MRPATDPIDATGTRFALPDRRLQTAIGLLLAAAIGGGWLGIHFYAMLVFELSWSNLPFALLLAGIQCWLSVGVFIVCHDAMHGSLAPGHRRLNEAIGLVLLFLYAGFRWQFLRDAHFDHHKHPGTENDPDFDADHPSRFAPWYATFFRRYFGWQSLVFVHVVVGIYWLLLDVPMVQIVLLYGAPALLSSLQLFYFGTYRPHRRDAAMPFADHHHARTDGFGNLTSLLTCFHFGYHLEHHHRPDIPWWALPAARRAGVSGAQYSIAAQGKEAAR